jgi:hypothetical protein
MNPLRHRPLAVSLILLSAFVTCARKPEQPAATSTTATSSATTTAAAMSDAERTRRADNIRAWFSQHEASKSATVVATTRTESGQIIDWIRPESQLPAGMAMAKPPAGPGGNKAPADAAKIAQYTKAPDITERTARTEVQMQKAAQGPPGTVPVVRFSVDEFLKSVRELPENPADVFKKPPPPAPDTNMRYYGVWQRFGTFFGTAGRINIWDPAGPVSGETSIAQTAVIRGTPMQAIEAGKIELNSLNGDDRPHFFTFYRTNGGATGDWVGGYNTLVKGWIQVGASVAPGMSLAAWSSTSGGAQFSLDLEVRLWQGNWWVWAAGQWAGYYPHCIGGGTADPCQSGTLFSAGGIRDQADRLDWYGEVFDKTAPSPTSTDMGSGRFAAEGWGKAAYFRNLTFYWAPNTYWWWDSGSASATDSGCYSVSGPFFSQSDPNYHNWWLYGGPGKEVQTCK